MSVPASLSDLQRKVLLVLLDEPSMTPNGIGYAVGAEPVEGGRGLGGRGRGHRVFGRAQRVIAPLNGLKKRGLVLPGPRADGLSGVEYSLTGEGRRVAEALKAR